VQTLSQERAVPHGLVPQTRAYGFCEGEGRVVSQAGMQQGGPDVVWQPTGHATPPDAPRIRGTSSGCSLGLEPPSLWGCRRITLENMECVTRREGVPRPPFWSAPPDPPAEPAVFGKPGAKDAPQKFPVFAGGVGGSGELPLPT